MVQRAPEPQVRYMLFWLRFGGAEACVAPVLLPEAPGRAERGRRRWCCRGGVPSQAGVLAADPRGHLFVLSDLRSSWNPQADLLFCFVLNQWFSWGAA